MSVAARYRYTLVAGATAVVIGTGFTAVGLSRHSDAGTTSAAPAADSAPLSAGAGVPPPPVDELLLNGGGPSASPTVSATSKAPPKATPSATPSATAAKKAVTSRRTPKPSR